MLVKCTELFHIHFTCSKREQKPYRSISKVLNTYIIVPDVLYVQNRFRKYFVCSK